MNVYVCTDHESFNPVGACSVVIAASESEARGLLEVALCEHGLYAGKPFTLRQLSLEEPKAFILVDGDY